MKPCLPAALGVFTAAITIASAEPSTIRYELELGGNNHADEWESLANPPMFTPGSTADGQVLIDGISTGGVITWAVRVSVSGVHANGYPPAGIASLGFGLTLRRDDQYGPLAYIVASDKTGTEYGWFSSVNDGDADGVRGCWHGADPDQRAAFAVSYDVAGNGNHGRITDPLGLGGPSLDLYTFPMASGYPAGSTAPTGMLIGFHVGYPTFSGSGCPGPSCGLAGPNTPGVGLSAPPSACPTALGAVPIVEGQINGFLPSGVYTLAVLPMDGNRILNGSIDCLASGQEPFALDAEQVIGDTITFRLLSGGCPGPSIITIARHPSSVTTCPGRDAVFHVGAIATCQPFPSNTGPVTSGFRWKGRNGNLVNGPTGTGSIISGATTPRLEILNVGPADAAAGPYRCTVGEFGTPAVSNPATLTVGPAIAHNVIISQLYTAGGDAGAAYQTDFVELFNPGLAPVDLADWSVQYADSGSESWASIALSGVILPGHYYTILGAPGNGCGGAPCGLPLPGSADLVQPVGINLSPVAGKIALLHGGEGFVGGCPYATNCNVVDYVAYGYSGDCCFEGLGKAAGPYAPGQSIQRVCSYDDTDENRADFVAAPVIPRAGLIPGDFDGDGDVDGKLWPAALGDLPAFLACVTGPSVAYDAVSLPEGCTLAPDCHNHLGADLDRDGDVDQDDFGIFQRCYSGPNRPGNPACDAP